MAVYNAWTIEYLNGSTWTAVSNVQDLTCTVGRQTAVDQWPVSSASMRMWYPNGYTTPLANLTIGTKIRFFAPGRSSTKPSWTGVVQNVRLDLGIPWNSGTSKGNADFLTVDAEGHYGEIGRRKRQGQVDEILGYMNVDALNSGLRSLAIYWFSYLNEVVCDRDSGDWALSSSWDPGPKWRLEQTQMITQAQIVSLFRLCDGIRKTWVTGYGNADDPAIYFGRPYGTASSIAPTGFSDTTNDASWRKYDQVAFDGLADLYFNQAVLTAPQYIGTGTEVSSTIGVSPLRTFTADVPDNALSASNPYNKYQDAADYWANAFYPPDIAISSISATTNGQHTQNLDTLGVTDLELGYLPLYVVPVTLRGTTFYCQIEGVTVTADTNQARFTYYVTPTDTTAWFILDSSTFGVLDANRLGIY